MTASARPPVAASPRPKRASAGRRWRRLVSQVVIRDHGKCWICGHWNAKSADHVVPVTEDPSREWDMANLRAAHGYPAGCADCTIAAARLGNGPIYCNEIRQYGSVERARRKIAERTGLQFSEDASAPQPSEPFEPEGRL